MIEYRKAIINDIDNLAKLRSEFLMEANDICSEIERDKMEIANKNYFEKALVEDSFVAWLAFDGDRIIATSGLSFSIVPPSFKCPDGKVAYIMNMFTSSDYRKQGIGMELLKRTVEEAKNRGYYKITLNSTDMGRPLYEKYGFKDIKGDMVFYPK